MKRAAATEVARGLLLVCVLGAATAAGFGLSSTDAVPAANDGQNTMNVLPADSGVVAIGSNFTVEIHVTGAGLAYTAVDSQLEWDAAGLEHVSNSPSGSILSLPGSLALGTGDPPGTEEIHGMGGLVGSSPVTTTGKVWTVTLRCDQPGTYPLHLVPVSEDAAFGTATAAVAGVSQPMALHDGRVTCQGEGAPVPTATPGAGATPTTVPGTDATPTATPGTGATPTPTGPTPTPTPLPPGLEAVTLVAGCNPVASTYPDGTPIQTIADAVGPEGNLVSLWEFDLGTWRAFSPHYPAESDLTQADMLDVLFACVGGPGAFVRPEV